MILFLKAAQLNCKVIDFFVPLGECLFKVFVLLWVELGVLGSRGQGLDFFLSFEIVVFSSKSLVLALDLIYNLFKFERFFFLQHVFFFELLVLVFEFLRLLKQAVVVALGQVEHRGQLMNTGLVLLVESLELSVYFRKLFLLNKSSLDFYVHLMLHFLFLLYQEINLILMMHHPTILVLLHVLLLLLTIKLLLSHIH